MTSLDGILVTMDRRELIREQRRRFALDAALAAQKEAVTQLGIHQAPPPLRYIWGIHQESPLPDFEPRSFSDEDMFLVPYDYSF
jgi:hypothetical protein